MGNIVFFLAMQLQTILPMFVTCSPIS